MKLLIWVLNFFVFSFLNVLLGEATGIRIGYLLLYLICFYSARSMCKSWDKHKIAKKAAKEGISSFEYIKKEIPEDILKNLENNRRNYDLIKATLKELVKGSKVSRVYSDILLEEYMKVKTTSPSVLETAILSTGEPSRQTYFCRKCGQKLIDGSKFCSKCGTAVIEISE